MTERPWFLSEAGGHELPAQIETALQSLPRDQRTVLTLKVWAGLTFSQIAEVESIAQGTAASRYRYALDALRRKLGNGVLPE